MKRFLNWFGCALESKPASAKRMHTFCPQLEQLDQRLVPSLSSAISIQHMSRGSVWTEMDWYTVDHSAHDTQTVVEFQGTSRRNLAIIPNGGPIGRFVDLSASVDPKTGSGEVFVVQTIVDLGGVDIFSNLSVIDSAGTVHELIGFRDGAAGWTWMTGISATRDGHVYVAEAYGAVGVHYLDSNGSRIELGTPKPGLAMQPLTADNIPKMYSETLIAASVGYFGGNEVFVIGADGYIYVNKGNAGVWLLVDNSAQFVSLSATPNDTVFAVTSDGRLFQETEHLYIIQRFFYLSWTSQDISGGRIYSANISADTDASGQDEVYAIQNGTNYLYVYDAGSWTYKDSDVYDVSGAGAGYFYDVNYYGGSYEAWKYDPTGWWSHWSDLGSNLS